MRVAVDNGTSWMGTERSVKGLCKGEKTVGMDTGCCVLCVPSLANNLFSYSEDN